MFLEVGPELSSPRRGVTNGANHGLLPCRATSKKRPIPERERALFRYQPKLTPTVPLDSPPPATDPPINKAPLPEMRREKPTDKAFCPP